MWPILSVVEDSRSVEKSTIMCTVPYKSAGHHSMKVKNDSYLISWNPLLLHDLSF